MAQAGPVAASFMLLAIFQSHDRLESAKAKRVM